MTNERAVLAGGCFWGMQDLIRNLPGVISTNVGYTGGDVANATYRNHGTHAEGIEIIYDPGKTNFRNLLEFFFQIHDPSTLDRQGNDRGVGKVIKVTHHRPATATATLSGCIGDDRAKRTGGEGVRQRYVHTF